MKTHETARKTVERGRLAREFVARSSAMPPVRIGRAVLVTALVCCAQLFLLGQWYLIGQGLTLLLNRARGQEIETAVRQEGYARLLHPGALGQLLPMNGIAGACLAVCLGTLVVAYRRVMAGQSVDEMVTGLAVPGSILLAVALAAITIDALVEPSALTNGQLSAGVQPSAGKADLEMGRCRAGRSPWAGCASGRTPVPRPGRPASGSRHRKGVARVERGCGRPPG